MQEWVAIGDDTMELNKDLSDSNIVWFSPSTWACGNSKRLWMLWTMTKWPSPSALKSPLPVLCFFIQSKTQPLLFTTHSPIKMMFQMQEDLIFSSKTGPKQTVTANSVQTPVLPKEVLGEQGQRRAHLTNTLTLKIVTCQWPWEAFWYMIMLPFVPHCSSAGCWEDLYLRTRSENTEWK